MKDVVLEQMMESSFTGETPRLSEPVDNIIIIGAMGCGKSSVGWLAAKILGFGFIDLDEYIERSEKMGVTQIFNEKGESYFRDIEKQAVESLRGIRSHVIATGGGAVVDDENWQAFCDMGATVWLNTSPQEIARRFVSDETELKKRPLLAELAGESDKQLRQRLLTERLSALIGQRQARYKQADVILTDTFSTPESSAKKLVRTLIREGLVRTPGADAALDRWGSL